MLTIARIAATAAVTVNLGLAACRWWADQPAAVNVALALACVACLGAWGRLE